MDTPRSFIFYDWVAPNSLLNHLADLIPSAYIATNDDADRQWRHSLERRIVAGRAVNARTHPTWVI
ncbi:hypothetical protein EDC02_7853 [Micromonospora sp. Llam0]|nr:hypothetical protein EDC02_7853 [Micromonospora sp. Llam0]